jgi:hypothetical protein
VFGCHAFFVAIDDFTVLLGSDVAGLDYTVTYQGIIGS